MNIELDEVVIQDVSDDAMELAAGGAQGGVPLGIAIPLSHFTKGGPLCRS